MVAFQTAEYDPKTGRVMAPRRNLMVLHWEPNGTYSFDKGCWHRQTISIKLHEHLRHKVAPFRKLLEAKGAEVYEVDQKTSTVVDIFYFIADPAEQALVDKLIGEGKKLRRPTDSELTPKKSPGRK